MVLLVKHNQDTGKILYYDFVVGEKVVANVSILNNLDIFLMI